MTNNKTLKEIWPRFGWSEHINDERPDELLRVLDKVYESIREAPRSNEGDITNDQWQSAYENGLIVLKSLFRKTKSIEEAVDMNKRFAERLLLNCNSINQTPLTESYHYWALSKVDLTHLGSEAFPNLNKPQNLTELEIEKQ